ncbi:disulfide bond formation protein B [Novosphingopyxis sp.]|uniref:disulfide bond formation protein B n=1 Tax=Novosphingopyxis sp. TaxID=2709690 RepID=UPI003B59497B
MTGLRAARRLALLIPAALLGGAYLGQYAFGLYPCEMCWWQRWPHFAALALALLSFTVKGAAIRPVLLLAGLAILISGLIGGFHSGVEYGWWEGVTSCSSTIEAAGGDYLDAIMNAPIVRCDQVQWSLFGISLAGYNFLISVAGATVIFVMASRRTAG